MPQPSHQTVKLTRGKHSSPVVGACVMELASMLAGEPFSDHPESVSRPLAAFLRCYNDRVDDRRRQDLYEYAARAVGTAGPPEVERAQADRLLQWADARWRERRRGWVLGRGKRRDGREPSKVDWESAARYAVHSIGRVSGGTHAAVLDLLDELIALGSPAPPEALGPLPPLRRPAGASGASR